MKTLPALIALAFLLALSAGPARSEEGKSASRQDVIKKEKRLEDVKKKIKEEKKGVKETSGREVSILGEIEKIDKDLARKRAEHKRITARLEGIRRDIIGLNSEISEAGLEKGRIRDRLKARLRAIYRIRNGEVGGMLADFASAEDLGMKYRYLAIVMDSDSDLITNYEKNLSSLGAKRLKLISFQKAMEESERDAKRGKAEIEAARKTRTAMLDDVRREKDKRLMLVHELEQSAEALKDLLKSMKRGIEDQGATGFASMKGRLKMPVDGRVVSGYGSVRHPVFKTVTFNNGIVIDSPAGTPVKSVYSGVIAYTGWLKGYGQTVIIDHGGGFYTLFSYLSDALKSNGERVDEGDSIGLVGDTGITSSPGLYFEIREKGVPRDPSEWFAEK
jgi:septal ring factor EnvC (AmiA/AmiB activator)